MARARTRAPAGPPPRWWAVRRAQNRKPVSYRCPLCGRQLYAMSEHMLIAPEGDGSRRRHAHSECVAAARKRGRLLTYDDWRKANPPPPGWLRRLVGRLRRAPREPA